MKRYFAYLLASHKNGTLYIGITSDLSKRISLHQSDIIKGFTKKYSVHNLVYFEEFDTAIEAIAREKQLKNWKREWKIDLVQRMNLDWNDLTENLNFL